MCKGHFEESESKKKTQEKPGSIKCSFEHYWHKLISVTSKSICISNSNPHSSDRSR